MLRAMVEDDTINSNKKILGKFVEFIYCGCNCGFTRPKYDNRGRECRYIQGHSWNKIRLNYCEFVYCKCGCKKTRSKYDSQGRIREYINNHDKKIENPPTKKERWKIYYEKNREIILKKSSDYGKNHKERRRKRDEKNRERNNKKHREWRKQYYAKHPEKKIIYWRRYKEKAQVYAKTRYTKNRFKILLVRKKSLNNLRERLFHLLGHVCVRCGYFDKRALQFDHINGHGTKERLLYPNKEALYKKYLNDPELAKKTFQILCSNCNWLKKFEKSEINSNAVI